MNTISASLHLTHFHLHRGGDDHDHAHVYDHVRVLWSCFMIMAMSVLMLIAFMIMTHDELYLKGGLISGISEILMIFLLSIWLIGFAKKASISSPTQTTKSADFTFLHI